MTEIQNHKPVYDPEERTFQEANKLKKIFSSILAKSK
jgi:hypothetical protein